MAAIPHRLWHHLFRCIVYDKAHTCRRGDAGYGGCVCTIDPVRHWIRCLARLWSTNRAVHHRGKRQLHALSWRSPLVGCHARTVDSAPDCLSMQTTHSQMIADLLAHCILRCAQFVGTVLLSCIGLIRRPHLAAAATPPYHNPHSAACLSKSPRKVSDSPSHLFH